MKPSFSRWLLFGLLLLLSSVVQAEGECPPGMFPTNPPGAQGPVGCAPIPGYDQKQARPRAPPPIWEPRWGAIATDFAHNSAGASVDQPDQSSADEAALAECQSNGGSDCKIELKYGNGCAALAVGKTGHNAKAGTTLDQAIQSAMKVCNAADSHCFIYYSACSLPVQIQ